MKTQRLADGTVHKLPADFRKAIESDAATKSLWSEITPLARNEWICWVTSAKQDTTRKRRIEVGLDKMRGACAGRAVGLDARTAEALRHELCLHIVPMNQKPNFYSSDPPPPLPFSDSGLILGSVASAVVTVGGGR